MSVMMGCPICGKLPKVKSFYYAGYKVSCKPLFGKAHLIICVEYTSDIVREWNKAVRETWEVNEPKEG